MQIEKMKDTSMNETSKRLAGTLALHIICIINVLYSFIINYEPCFMFL